MSAKRNSKQVLELHQRKAERAKKLIKEDILHSQFPYCQASSSISMHLQQVLFIPTLTHSDMLYLSQLSCYNFCISLADTKQSVWHEGVSRRGANEIVSCLLNFLNLYVTIKKDLVIWSDNYAGRNRNRMFLKIRIFNAQISCRRPQYDREIAQIEKKKSLAVHSLRRSA